jgi:hypothetical protein
LLLDGFPILWVIRGGYTEVTNEITDIKPGNVDQNIFSLPNDYTKISWQEAVQLKGDLLVTDKKKQKPAKDISK